MAFGSGARQWVRGTQAKIAASNVALGQGEILVDDAGRLYGGDGTTQIKNLQPAVRPSDLANSASPAGIALSAAIARENRGVNIVASSGATETLPIESAMHVLTLTASCTLTFPTPTAGQSFLLYLVQDATGTRTVTWPTSTRFPGGVAPVLSPSPGKTDALSFICADGAHWDGFLIGQGMQ